jgi:AcrR family transcriptional regulator
MINAESPRPRGRPRAFDRDAALRLARQTFWRLGYEGASICDLTEAMGITPQSLYAAFQSKAELYREALAHYRRTDGAFIWRALDEEPTAAAGFRRALAEAAHQYARPDQPGGCMVSTGTVACAEEHRPVAEYVMEMRQETRDRFCARIRRGIEAGDVPADIDIPAIARFAQAALQGMSIQARDGASEAELTAIARMACDQLDRQLSAG